MEFSIPYKNISFLFKILLLSLWIKNEIGVLTFVEIKFNLHNLFGYFVICF